MILNWYGSYNDETLKNDIEFGNGLYLITGKQPYERESTIQYCGITEGSFYNRLLSHHKKDDVTEISREYWLAEITYPKRSNRDLLEIAEKIIVYFWQPSLNEKKKISLPEPTTVINQWFNIEGQPRINQMKIYKELSDVISWDGEYWRTGNLKIFNE
ncbi:MAG: hypothetical protein GQ569_12305 [Methylococcaceae bacterium]|nr:hypothetical protein [Methylococcaceae bacterium]